MSTSHVQFLTSAHKNIRQIKPIEQLTPVCVEHSNNPSNNFNITMGVSNTIILDRNFINTPINGHSTRLLPELSPEIFRENRASSAKRSLFGSPKPGEMKNMYNEHVQRQRDRFLEKYGFDVFTEKFVNDNDLTVREKPAPRIVEGQDISSNTNNNNNDNNNNSETKNLENNLVNGEDRLHEQNNDEKNNSKLKLNTFRHNITLIENSNCNKLINNENCDEYHVNKTNNNNINNNDNECNNINEITNSNKIPQSISTTSTQTTPLKDKKSSLISCERSKPYIISTKQSRMSDYYASRKKILTSDTPKPQKAKLYDENKTNELQQNNHEKLEGGQKF